MNQHNMRSHMNDEDMDGVRYFNRQTPQTPQMHSPTIVFPYSNVENGNNSGTSKDLFGGGYFDSDIISDNTNKNCSQIHDQNLSGQVKDVAHQEPVLLPQKREPNGQPIKKRVKLNNSPRIYDSEEEQTQYLDYSDWPECKQVFFKPGKFVFMNKKKSKHGYSCRCCPRRVRPLKDTPKGYEFVYYNCPAKERKLTNWKKDFPLSPHHKDKSRNNFRPECIEYIDNLFRNCRESNEVIHNSTCNAIIGLANDNSEKDGRIAELESQLQDAKNQLCTADQTFLSRLSKKQYREDILPFVAKRIVVEEKEILSKYYVIKKDRTRYINPKYNLQELAKRGYREEWESKERESTTLYVLLNGIEHYATQRSDNYERTERSHWNRLCAKHTSVSGVQGVVNLRCVTPFKIRNGLFIRQQAQSRKITKFLSIHKITLDPRTLEDFLDVQILRWRRTQRLNFQFIRATRERLPKTIFFRQHQTDNDQIVLYECHKNLMKKNPTIVYTNNMRTITVFLTWKIEEDHKKTKKPEKIPFEKAYLQYRKKDKEKRKQVLVLLFEGLMEQRKMTEELLNTVLIEHPNKECKDMSGVFYDVFEKVLKSVCSECGGYSDGDGKKCDCGGAYVSKAQARYDFNLLLEKCRFALGNVENKDKKVFPSVPMKGFDDKYVKNKKSEVFKGVSADPGSEIGVKKLVRNIRKDNSKIFQKVGFVGLDGSPLVKLISLKMMEPETYEWLYTRLCLLHDQMEMQQVIIDLTLRLIPAAFDILGNESEAKKKRLLKNSSFKQSRDFCFIVAGSMYHEMKIEMERIYDSKITSGEMYAKYYERLSQEHKCSTACVYFDLLVDRIGVYIESRRGNYEGVESHLRNISPWYFSDNYHYYQKIKVHEYNTSERTKVGHGELNRMYSCSLLHPTKRGHDDHEYQETGSILEEKNGDVKDSVGRKQPTYDRWDKGTEIHEPLWPVLELVLKNSRLIRDCEYTNPNLLLDVVAVSGVIKNSEIFESQRCSTLDHDGEEIEMGSWKVLDFLVGRMERLYDRMIECMKKKKKMFVVKKEVFTLCFEGEVGYEFEFIFEGSEEEIETLKESGRSETFGGAGCHKAEVKKKVYLDMAIYDTNGSFKFQSKLQENGGKMECCDEECDLLLDSIYDAVRCFVCHGYCNISCSDHQFLTDNNGDVIGLDFAVCHSCRDKLLCSDCKKEFEEEVKAEEEEEEEDGENMDTERVQDMQDENEGKDDPNVMCLDCCSHCRKFLHRCCLKKISNLSKDEFEYLCPRCSKKWMRRKMAMRKRERKGKMKDEK